MNDDKTTYYLYVTPWVAFGHLRRPCWVLRAIQRVFLGWRWYANETALAGLSAVSPEHCDAEPYTRHLPDKDPSTRITWPRN